MNLRLSSLRAMFVHQGAGRLMAAAALAFALAGAGLGNAVAAPGDAASAPDAAPVSYANGGQFTVRAGQSLNDVAIAVTQSHDRATLARASRALFEANPNAFMSHDPSRMRVGAVLTVPVLDASGALAASSAGVASAVSATAASAPGTAVASGPASGVAQVNAAAASAASAAARAATPAAPAVSATASVAAEASSPASATVVSSTPVAGSQPAALPASGAHEWAGSIQPSASEPVEGASAPGAAIAGTSAAQPASQPRAQVSSLQQLLALKNRVLMELQKHGIGGTPAATGAAQTNVAQPAPGASSAAAVSGHVAAPVASTSKDVGLSQTELSVAAAVGAALVVLLAALRMGRRKRERVAAAEAVSTEGNAAGSARATSQQGIVSTREEISVHEAPDAAAEADVRNGAALAAAEREAAEGDAAAREMAERVAAERDAEIRRAAAREAEEQAAAERAAEERAAAERAAGEQAAAERAAAEQAAAERVAEEQAAAERAAEEQTAAERATAEQAAAERAEAEQEAAGHMSAEPAAERAATQQAASGHEATAHATSPAQDPAAPPRVWQERDVTSASVEPAQVDPNIAPSAQSDFTPEPLPAPPLDHFDDATLAASLAAAAELGAEALPLAPPEPLDGAFPHEEPVHRLQWDDEPAAPQEPLPEAAPLAQSQPAPAVPTEFPRDAVDAFGSLDMPLPPRVESSADHVHVPASLSTQPVSSQEATAKQSAAEHHPDDTPHIADEIDAGTAGHAAVAGLGAGLGTGLGAGLGAPGFGALKLDFDLELPPGPAEPLPTFTQADLIRIARNKLDLAAEYIELGDLSGARALINEVIETNDPGTRTEARALLSTLAPLS
ncbi:FimV/HubP family polar landmark protein [Paraburkholderia dioscoreae]|uniref:FimV C-terminal domain protein n=1 Tax=Paraburkholderia dioscoreae TaxID=2604047 RepID=A0A5Q4ZHU5_9BURK|nr:FimV/HubP family polar landmark protein [Paraburkholderia dioscoreae]VVD31471.1 FimV C-terminal domain protein [Paraburkholderia dioscoreae]